jgi:peptidoglycan/xylan/chitin deacetylase (PgdA/CDA1 family)
MNIVKYLMESRGPVNAMKRLPKLAQRFGVTTRPMERALKSYVDITERYDTRPTLAVTAVLLERYPRVFQTLAERGVELALHGWVHTDYSLLDEQAQALHMERCLEAFEALGISPVGTRCPYLRWNEESFKVGRRFGLAYSSNAAVAWDVVERNGHSNEAWEAYQKGLALYKARDSGTAVGLPSTMVSMLDLPVSQPDDEAVVDRLHLGARARSAAWRGILERVYEQGELFTLVLHHERLPIMWRELGDLLEDARGRAPKVWVAQMREVAAWWQRRSEWRLAVENQDGGGYRVTAPREEGATVLVRGKGTEAFSEPWHGEYRLVSFERFTVPGKLAPCVGVSEDAPESLVGFLESEGYVVRRGDRKCAVVIDREEFNEEDKRPLMAEVEASEGPLVRLWRWPEGARCALSVTGDVDSMTIVDFLRRPLEV